MNKTLRRCALGLSALLGGCFGAPYPKGSFEQLFPGAPPPQMHTQTVAGHTLRYVEADHPGSPRILFVHGSPGEWQAFAAYLKDPALQHYGPMLIPDRPGYGGSEAHHIVSSLAEQARRIAPLLKGPGGPTIVVGHSLGGAIAAKLAMDYPSEVRGVLLLAPSVAPTYEAPRWYQKLAAWPVVDWLIPRELADANRELMPLQSELRKMEPGWATLRMPVYVVQGTADGLVDPRTADYLQRMLAHTPHRIWRYADAGHLLLWEHPQVIVSALQALIAATAPDDRQ
ncbi:alpha/beta fold hydrolase [Solimonas marina]|uniref:Alpha/beta hydrolase n=1 Tax=Solimonas marina TaxID=2714601 RepID=A0A969WCI5_9GAMM|nr:alpha/beta fold hydrolase [Solimonas marina]NKF24029.1 alpha/beta hydrolase [Solimonas marina]